MAKAKILIVDDNEKDLKLLESHLSGQGHIVVTAKDGNDAINQLETQKPDLVIMDIMMSEMSGWKTCQKIKEDPRYKHIPVLLCSALIQDDGEFSRYEMGDGYLQKPINLIQLVSTIQKLLGQAS